MNRKREASFKGSSKLADFRDALMISSKFDYEEDDWTETLTHKKSGLTFTFEKNEDPDFGPLELTIKGEFRGAGMLLHLLDDEISRIFYTTESVDIIFRMSAEPYITFQI